MRGLECLGWPAEDGTPEPDRRYSVGTSDSADLRGAVTVDLRGQRPEVHELIANEVIA